MKTTDRIETTPSLKSRRSLSTIPAGAGGRSENVIEEEPEAICPFRVNVPEAELTELRRRIKATKWPERETVKDATQGVQLATMQALARYWSTEYDWRKCEARLNALPQFITEIDGGLLEVRSPPRHERHEVEREFLGVGSEEQRPFWLG